MMTLIDNHHAVFLDKRFYLSNGYARLDEGNINDTMQRIAVRTECANRGGFLWPATFGFGLFWCVFD